MRSFKKDTPSHKKICCSIEDTEKDKNVREQLSTTYGVNRLSVLDYVEHFDVCQCMPEDIMHILLEGLVPYETKLLLQITHRWKENPHIEGIKPHGS